MLDAQTYSMQSLELHLFFARIMKEHTLFLKAAFLPPNTAFAKKAEWFKQQFESLLSEAVALSRSRVCTRVLDSGEVVTPFTLNAERQTSRFTGIPIDSSITQREMQLHGAGYSAAPDSRTLQKIAALNRTALRLLNGLIEFKERILNDVKACRMFTTNYPLLIEHILREAKLYRTYVTALENGTLTEQYMKDTELFWNQIMMEHAMFIRGLLDPSETALIETSDTFAQEYEALLAQARAGNDLAAADLTDASLQETLRFRDFKRAGADGIQNCKIESVILPLLADHVLREANHYIRLLEAEH
ncbi:MAG: DUF2935 domain-containing protein [Monoglobaceae bacterium]